MTTVEKDLRQEVLDNIELSITNGFLIKQDAEGSFTSVNELEAVIDLFVSNDNCTLYNYQECEEDEFNEFIEEGEHTLALVSLDKDFIFNVPSLTILDEEDLEDYQNKIGELQDAYDTKDFAFLRIQEVSEDAKENFADNCDIEALKQYIEKFPKGLVCMQSRDKTYATLNSNKVFTGRIGLINTCFDVMSPYSTVLMSDNNEEISTLVCTIDTLKLAIVDGNKYVVTVGQPNSLTPLHNYEGTVEEIITKATEFEAMLGGENKIVYFNVCKLLEDESNEVSLTEEETINLIGGIKEVLEFVEILTEDF